MPAGEMPLRNRSLSSSEGIISLFRKQYCYSRDLGGKAPEGSSSSGSATATAPERPFGSRLREAGTSEKGSSAGSAGARGRSNLAMKRHTSHIAASTINNSNMACKAEPLLEQRIYEFLRIKWQQIAGLLSYSDVTHGQSQLARNGYDNAALGGPVQFR